MKIKKRVLFFANIPVNNNENSLGGATVLASEILEFLKKQNTIDVKHTQIRKFWKHKLQILDYIYWIFKFPFHIQKYEVISIHGTQDLHFTIAPILCFWAKIFNKKLVYHFFGGEFHEQYDKLPSFFRFLIKNTILKADALLIETKQVIEYFNKYQNLNIIWLPNSRKPNIIENEIKQNIYTKRYVFISRVIPEKGIDIIIEAANKLESEYVIDVFGPKDKNYTIKSDNDVVNYKGILEPNEVINKLKQYDILLLPTYFKGEGYPGIIIEALSLGKPVITTYWKSIPEIITNNFNGLLINIKNEKELEDAIKYFNNNNYLAYSKNALKSFDNFNSEIVFKKVLESYIC